MEKLYCINNTYIIFTDILPKYFCQKELTFIVNGRKKKTWSPAMWEYLQVGRSYEGYSQNKGMSGLYFGSKHWTIFEVNIKTKPQRQLEFPTRMCNSMPCNLGHTVVGSRP